MTHSGPTTLTLPGVSRPDGHKWKSYLTPVLYAVRGDGLRLHACFRRASGVLQVCLRLGQQLVVLRFSSAAV